MADVAYIPITKAYLDFRDRSTHIFLPNLDGGNFSAMAKDQASRKEFEPGQRRDGWAQEALSTYCKQGKGFDGLFFIADEKHPLRLGGSALTILEGPGANGQYVDYVVSTARGTNQGPIKAPANVLEHGYFKNAGGLPNDVATHRRPDLVGMIEGVEEILFLNGMSVLHPDKHFEWRGYRAIDAAVSRLQKSMLVSSTGPRFSLTMDDRCRLEHFPLRSKLLVYEAGEPTKLNCIENCIVTWNAEVSTLEISKWCYVLDSHPEHGTNITGIVTGDGIGDKRFAEDVFISPLETMRSANWAEDIFAQRLGTLDFQNFSWDTCRMTPQVYRWAATLPDLLDAYSSKYSFDRMLRRMEASIPRWKK